MQRRNIYLMIVILGMLLMVATGLWLGSAQSVSAQCGSSASSCKNCHEVQGEMPVNSDGTAWHQSHAFGDFCYICHAGNNQATDITEAHIGMVAPLSDIQASCAQCHPGDLEARAQVYATTLGIEIGSSSTPSDPPEITTTSGESTTSETVVSSPATTELDIDDPNLVDYEQHYDEIVLGKRPVNWGNIILIGMIGILLFGGGGFVLKNEKLVKFSFGDTKKVEGDYPSDVVDMLPAISKLKPQARKSMQNILNNPTKTEKVLGLIEEVISDKKDEE
jgi:hypothetical protein